MESRLTAAPNPNPTADTAWACTVYAMVPYIGILFVPFALAISGFGLTRSGSRDRRRFLGCAGITLGILAIQLFLWWLLYIIPETAV